jgi:hypothetical protein
LIEIFSGAFGSGKTEICLNMALELAGEHPVLADLDIVNPYFCSRERQGVLAAAGITYTGPSPAMSLADLPYITPAITGYIRSGRRLFLDVGGDQSGCAVLGYLSQEILTRPYCMNLVVNPFRPFAETEDQVARLRDALENASRLRFAAVISNPNLSAVTCADDVLAGHQLVAAMAVRLGLPLRCLAVEKKLCAEVQNRLEAAVTEGLLGEVKIYPVEMHLRPDWL